MKRLFITGMFRTGTSLVSTALNVHPRVTIAWQPYMLFFKEVRNKFFAEILKETIDPDFPMGILTYQGDSTREMLKEVLNLVTFNETQVTDLLSAIKKGLKEKDRFNRDMKYFQLIPHLDGFEPGTAGHILEQLVHCISLSSKESDLVGIKEVFCEEFAAPFLNHMGPDSRVIHILRDPRAIAASRNYGKYRKAVGTRYPLMFIIKSWKRSVDFAKTNSGHTHYKMVKYEDMVRSPMEPFANMHRFLELEFDPKTLDVSNYRNARGEKWTQNSSFEGEDRISPRSIDRWRQVLPAKEIKLIETFCREEMEYLGYDLRFTGFEDLSSMDIEDIEDSSIFPLWLQKYDFCIKME